MAKTGMFRKRTGRSIHWQNSWNRNSTLNRRNFDGRSTALGRFANSGNRKFQQTSSEGRYLLVLAHADRTTGGTNHLFKFQHRIADAEDVMTRQDARGLKRDAIGG